MIFYECKKCGNITILIEDAGVLPVCCGDTMVQLKPLCEDAGNEKHVPVVNVEGNKVEIKVGEVDHPMSDAHYIKWIVLETNMGEYKRVLKPGQEPKATFTLAEGETPIKAYEFCNIHSLWSKKI